MSDLETAASCFFVPMIQEGATTAVDVERQITMSAWAAKTAMLFEHVNLRDPVYYSETERRALKDEGRPPGNIWIWAGRYVGGMVMCQEQSHVLFRLRDESARVSGHLSTICTGQLVVQVLSHREIPSEHHGWRILPTAAGPWEHTLIQIWPPQRHEVFWWPPAPITDENLELLGRRFVRGYLP